MKFTGAKEYLERAFALAERFTGKNLALPILANILVEVKGNTLTVTGTNLESAIQVRVPGNGLKDGMVSVPGKVASSFLQSLHEDKVQLEEKGGNVLMKTDIRETRINGVQPDDFPPVPAIKTTVSVRVDGRTLKKSLVAVLPAVSLSEFKPELTGVFFRINPQTLQLAATDTSRLAEKTLALSRKQEGGGQQVFILPRGVAQEISRAFSDDEEVEISYGENQAVFQSDQVRIISRCIDGAFPEYGAVIPKQFDMSGFMNRQELLRAVRSSSIFSSRFQDVTLVLSDKESYLTASNQDIGENRIRLQMPINGKGIRISFNYRYLLDALNALEGDDVFFGINGENAPSLLHDKADASFLYVVMPIRLA